MTSSWKISFGRKLFPSNPVVWNFARSITIPFCMNLEWVDDRHDFSERTSLAIVEFKMGLVWISYLATTPWIPWPFTAAHNRTIWISASCGLNDLRTNASTTPWGFGTKGSMISNDTSLVPCQMEIGGWEFGMIKYKHRQNLYIFPV